MDNSNLIIRQGRIFFQQRVCFRSEFYLKMCIDQMIIKFNNFSWNAQCEYWQNTEQYIIPYPKNNHFIQLEVYYLETKLLPIVVGEAVLHLTQINNHLNQEIKIPLTYDGLLVGNLYFEISTNLQEKVKPKQILYIHKINFVFLEDESFQTFHFRILKNSQQIYQKQFKLNQKYKTHFPSLKIPVKMSDTFVMRLRNSRLDIKQMKFLVDHIKRGKTSFYEVWIRNIHKNKIGDLKMQYFLENIFLQNQRQIFTRNGLVPSIIQSKTNLNKPIIKYQELQKLIIKDTKNNQNIKINQARNKAIKIKKTVSIQNQVDLKPIRHKHLITVKQKLQNQYQNTLNSIENLVNFQN